MHNEDVRLRSNVIPMLLNAQISEDLAAMLVAQSVERPTPGEEARVRFPLWPLAPYWLGLC